MSGTDNWLEHEHSLYEDLLTRCQEAVECEDWKGADRLIGEMVASLKRHMALEEEVLYPAYESEPAAPQGPTQALRAEHDQIVQLVGDVVRVIKSRGSEHALECLAHLENRMIKHHEKEEDIFLPMASHILDAKREEITRQLADFDASRSARKWNI